jgi:hypothetical protein
MIKHITIYGLANEVGILFELCHSILIQDARCHMTDCCKICAWLLTDEQEENPVIMYQDLQRDPQCYVLLYPSSKSSS